MNIRIDPRMQNRCFSPVVNVAKKILVKIKSTATKKRVRRDIHIQPVRNNIFNKKRITILDNKPDLALKQFAKKPIRYNSRYSKYDHLLPKCVTNDFKKFKSISPKRINSSNVLDEEYFIECDRTQTTLMDTIQRELNHEKGKLRQQSFLRKKVHPTRKTSNFVGLKLDFKQSFLQDIRRYKLSEVVNMSHTYIDGLLKN